MKKSPIEIANEIKEDAIKYVDKGGKTMTTKKDRLTKKETAFNTFQELIDAPAYWPSLKNKQLADWYDQSQEARNDKRRAHRI